MDGTPVTNSRLNVIAIVLTAASALPIFRAFKTLPLILGAIVFLGVGYILSASYIGKSWIQTALAAPVYGISSILFGFFASFQIYKILVKVIEWLDLILIDLFNWIGF